MPPADLIGLIPARGGSKGVRRKNLQEVGGIPLVGHAIETIGPHCKTVYVSTDDGEIAAVAEQWGAEILRRHESLATDDATVDDVIEALLGTVLADKDKWVLVYQPTVYGVDDEALTTFVAEFVDQVDKPWGTTSWVMGRPRRHIAWMNGDMLVPRGNRQILPNDLADEIGVRIYAPEAGSGIPQMVWVKEYPFDVIDIDTVADLHAARLHADRRTINIHAICGPRVGSGHVRRAINLADHLQHHDVAVYPVGEGMLPGTWTDWAPPWALDLVRDAGYLPDNYDQVRWADLVVYDCLDTLVRHTSHAKSQAQIVVTVEDRGPGAAYADLVVNAMYPAGLPHEVNGPRWADIRPSIRAVEYPADESRNQRLLVTFGGTDPGQFTEKASRVFAHWPELRVVPPPAREGSNEVLARTIIPGSPMAEHIAWADLVLTSGGRTVHEALCAGRPVVTLCQNLREMSHTHLDYAHGVLNLGLGALVTDERLLATVEQAFDMIEDLRMHAAGSVDGRGAERIATEIDRLLKEEP